MADNKIVAGFSSRALGQVSNRHWNAIRGGHLDMNRKMAAVPKWILVKTCRCSAPKRPAYMMAYMLIILGMLIPKREGVAKYFGDAWKGP